MEPPTHDSLPARPSLLERLRNLDDDVAWREFVRLYSDLVRGIARRRGLREDEADDVAQEVFAKVARSIPGFAHAGRRGAFRRWLGRLVHWRAEDQRRRRDRAGEEAAPVRDEVAEDRAGLESVPAPGGVAEEVAADELATLVRAAFRAQADRCRRLLDRTVTAATCRPAWTP